MAAAVKEVATMLAHPVDKDDLRELLDMTVVFEKSVVTAVPVTKGTTLERRHLAFKKPGTGIPARRYAEVIGRETARDLPSDVLLTEGDLT
jgi:N-acetylneuraminate synthase